MTSSRSTLPTTTWYFDVISPFAYLALGEIEAMAKTMTIAYRPVPFAGLLQHWKPLGPAEIAPKRIHTYRFCMWEAGRRGIPFRFPPAHPFNPLKTGFTSRIPICDFFATGHGISIRTRAAGFSA